MSLQYIKYRTITLCLSFRICYFLLKSFGITIICDVSIVHVFTFCVVICFVLSVSYYLI